MADAKVKMVYKTAQAIARIKVETTLIQEAIAVKTWKEARELVPVDTWSLHESIGIDKIKLPNGYYQLRVQAGMAESPGIHYSGRSVGAGIGGIAYYALYVELGTVKMMAQPFLRPALMAQMGKLPGGRKLVVF